MASSGKSPGSPIGSPMSSLLPKGGGPNSPGLKYEEEEPSCTERCRSRVHGTKIWEIAFGGNGIEVVCLWAKTCQNYAQVKDDFGRTALHAAASTGNLKAVEWLLKTQQCNINSKDMISGYTPLHRSIYFGHFHISRALIKHGADLNVRDSEGMTAFELCQMDRPIPFKQNQGDMTELTVWGSNANYNLGLGHQQPRHFPDVVPDFRRHEMSLAKVVMSTYHTVFLTQSGKVFVCGYGMSGRLGTREEGTVLTPTQVVLRNNGPCRDIAVGHNHSIFLTDTKVWTVGSNEHGQLGHSSGLQVQKLYTPRTVDSLIVYNIAGVLAGNFNSIFYNHKVVLMCGQNQGQFGRGFEEEADILTPVKLRLPLENVGNGHITSVGGNEFCTAICIEKRHVFLLRRHQYVRIDSKNTTSQEILKMEVTGEKNNTTLFLLTGSGRVLVWRENYNKNSNECKGSFTRLVFSGSRLLDVKDFSVSLSSLIVVTSTGEAYKAGWSCTNPPSIVARMEEKFGQVAGTDFQVAVRTKRNRREDEAPSMSLELMKVKRVPNVHTGLFVSSDLKGHNFAILQRHQMMDVTDIPEVIAESMMEDIAELYTTAHDADSIHDVLFEVGEFSKFPAHMFIVASASPVFSHLFKILISSQNGVAPLRIKVTNKLFDIDPSKSASLEDLKIFRALLDMIYTRKCIYMTVEWMENLFRTCPEKKKTGRYEEELKELSKFRHLLRTLKLETEEAIIHRFYNNADSQWDSVVVKNACPPTVNLREYWKGLPEMKFRRCSNTEDSDEDEVFADIVLESSDKKRFPVHKCILVARLEYYKSLFSANWSFSQPPTRRERGKPEDIIITFSSKAVEVLLECVYTNETPTMKDADFEVIYESLACADFTMNDRLLQVSESEMAKHITLKNAADVATFAWKHNAVQLKSSCYDFISLNLTSMLENKLLDNLPGDIMLEFSGYYKQSQREKLLLQRDLQKPASVPEPEEFDMAVQQTPEEIKEQLKEIEDADSNICVKKTPAKSTRNRVRLRSRTLSETESLPENEETGGETTVQPTQSGPATFTVVAGKGKVKRIGFTKDMTPPPTPTPSVASPPDRKYIVPLPMNKEIIADDTVTLAKTLQKKLSLKVEDFPTLGSAGVRTVPETVPVLKVKHPPGPSKAAMPLPFSKSASGNVWSRMPTAAEPVVGMRMSHPGPAVIVPNSPPKPALTPTAAVAGATAGPKKKTKWRAIKSESDIAKGSPAGEDKHSGSSSPQLTTDGRDRSNPWRTSETSEKSSQVVFSTIVEDEVEKKRNFEKATTKALPLMQVEDEVINHLTRKYTSEDTLDYIELLSVERVVTQNFSTPVWVQHPGAITAMSSTSSYPQFKG